MDQRASEIIEKFSEISLHLEDETIQTIETPWGKFTVAFQGDTAKPPILTVHDIGLNSSSNFKPFFSIPDVKALLEYFCLVHVNICGQESECQRDTACPKVDEIVKAIDVILKQLNIKSFIGMGYGAGAFILSSLALMIPDAVTGLILLNPTGEAASWTDYGYFKICSTTLRLKGMTQSTLDFLRWYHCGCLNDQTNTELVESFERRFSDLNLHNLSNWMNSYNQRQSLDLQRPSIIPNDKTNTMKTIGAPVLAIVGRHSPHIEHTRRMFTSLDPRSAALLELSDCRAPLDEQPFKVLQSIILFIQGLGYPLNNVRKNAVDFQANVSLHAVDEAGLMV